MDFKLAEKMVSSQLIPRGIKDPRVLDVFRKIDRRLFVPDEYKDSAFGDHPLPIGKNQTISQPFIVALMTELLELKGDEKVLEIGTGSGYQTAILAELSREVYSLERIPDLAKRANMTLNSLGYSNIHTDLRDGSLGWPEHAPYDDIIVTASCPGWPSSLIEQLTEKGKLVAPIGAAFGQILTLFTKAKGSVEVKEICGCMFVPLVGKEGLKET